MLLIILNYLITFNILIHNLLIDLSIITRLSLWSSQRSPCSPDSHHPKHLLAERTPIFPLQYLDCMIMQPPPPPITMIFFLFWRGGRCSRKIPSLEISTESVTQIFYFWQLHLWTCSIKKQPSELLRNPSSSAWA